MTITLAIVTTLYSTYIYIPYTAYYYIPSVARNHRKLWAPGSSRTVSRGSEAGSGPRGPGGRGFGSAMCVYLGGCQNYGPFLGVHIKGDIDINVGIDTDS